MVKLDTVKHTALKLIGACGFSFSLYCLTNLGMVISFKNTLPITNQVQLEQLLDLEEDKLNCHLSISIKFGDEKKGTAEARIYPDRTYDITLYRERTIGALRHELYHICGGHLDDIINTNQILRTFKSVFYYEPTANLYATFDLKL